MSRPIRGERQAKGRPKRRAAKTHFFKYQLAKNPSRIEENDLKRALQESLEEQKVTPHNGNSSVHIKNTNYKRTIVNSSTNSSDVSKTSNNSSSTSNGSRGSSPVTTNVSNLKRTRSGTSSIAINTPSSSKRAKLTGDLRQNHNGNNKTKCDNDASVLCGSAVALPQLSCRAIKTYSRGQLDSNGHQQDQDNTGPISSTPISKKPAVVQQATKINGVTESTKAPINYVSRSTQTTPPKIKQIQVQQVSKQHNGTEPRFNEAKKNSDHTSKTSHSSSSTKPPAPKPAPIQEPYQYLKFKRESKNYAYVKMTALKVSTSKSPSSHSRSTNSRKPSPNGVLHNNSNNKDLATKISPKTNANTNHKNSAVNRSSPNARETTGAEASSNIAIINSKNEQKQCSGKKSPAVSNSITVGPPDNDKSTDSCRSKQKQISQIVGMTNSSIRDSQITTTSATTTNATATTNIVTQIYKSGRSLYGIINNNLDLSEHKNQNQANLNVTKTRLPPGSWSLLGIPEEKVIYLRDDEPPRRLICYPAIKHIEGDVIQVRDSVLLRSGAKKTDLPYIAKVCAFWEDAETGGVMMSLYWYYRPEHTEDGRKQHHLPDEIFASRHRDVDSVECIEDKCYVLTFNEYCRYKKRCKMEEVNTTWSLADVTIPVSNETYPRRNRIPDMDVNPELVFCCRQIYDSRMRRLVKNPLINPKYGHI